MTSTPYLRRILVLLVLTAAVASSHAKAGGNEPFEPIDAKALIDACWAISQDKRDSGVTALMRQGGAMSVRCLKDVILDQAQAMLEPQVLSRRQVKEKLDKIGNAYGSLYWSIFNEHRKCSRWCGTDRHVYHLARYGGLLEKIIQDMVNERNEVKF